MLLGSQHHILRPDGDHSALRHRFPRIQDQVPDDLSDLPGVHLRRPEILGQGEFTPHPGTAHGQADGFLDHSGQAGRLPDRRASVGKGDELLGQAAGRQGGLLRLLQTVRQLLAGRDERLGQFEVEEDHREQIVEIMGNASRQNPRGLQLVQNETILLGPLAAR